MPRPGSTPLEHLAAVFRADSNPLSLVREGPFGQKDRLVRKDRPAGGHSRGVAPNPEKFFENFKFIDARVTVRSWCSCINKCYSRKSARPRARQYECRARANAIELTPGHPGNGGMGHAVQVSYPGVY